MDPYLTVCTRFGNLELDGLGIGGLSCMEEGER